MANFADYEAALRDALDTMGPAPRAELLHPLMLLRPAAAIGDLWASPAIGRSATTATSTFRYSSTQTTNRDSRSAMSCWLGYLLLQPSR
jgi:hypothetical protein